MNQWMNGSNGLSLEAAIDGEATGLWRKVQVMNEFLLSNPHQDSSQ